MNYHRLILLIALITFTTGYSAGNKQKGSDSASVTEKSRSMKKVFGIMIKQYLSAIGCKRRSSKQFVSQLKGNSSESDKYVSEHWKVKACDKTHNLKIDFYKDGNRVEVAQYLRKVKS